MCRYDYRKWSKAHGEPTIWHGHYPALGMTCAVVPLHYPSLSAQTTSADKASIRVNKERETKNEAIIVRMQSYEPITITTDWSSSMATFWRIWRTWRIYLHMIDSQGGKDPCRHDLYRAEIEQREGEKRETRNIQKWYGPPYLHFRTYTPPTIHIRSSYISAWVIVGIVREVELPVMTWHR
jgi:hypothetical protein